MKKVFITDKQGNKVLPKTHVSAVYDDEGNDLGSHLGAFEDEVRGLVDTPHQEYVTVATYASLPASGSEDTIYRVSNYDGSQSQVAADVYSEYAWDGTQYVFLCVKSAVGEVFDITVYNNNTKYADLTAALGVNGVNIPESLRKGGMSVKFVQSSDNKYVQYRLMSDTFNTTSANWQGVDNEPTAGSKNLVESSGIVSEINKIEQKLYDYNSEPLTIAGTISGYYLSYIGTWAAQEGQSVSYWNVEKGQTLKLTGGTNSVYAAYCFFDSLPTVGSIPVEFKPYTDVADRINVVSPVNGYIAVGYDNSDANSIKCWTFDEETKIDKLINKTNGFISITDELEKYISCIVPQSINPYSTFNNYCILNNGNFYGIEGSTVKVYQVTADSIYKINLSYLNTNYALCAWYSEAPIVGSTPMGYIPYTNDDFENLFVKIPKGAYYLAISGETNTQEKYNALSLYNTLYVNKWLNDENKTETQRERNRNKIAMYIGDSISAGYAWRDYIKEDYGLDYEQNKPNMPASVPGIPLRPNETEVQGSESMWWRCAENRLKNAGYNPTIISVFGGTNDFSYSTSLEILGTINDIPYVDDSSDFVDETTDVFSQNITFVSALKGCILMLKRDFPDAEIVIPTLLCCQGYGEGVPSGQTLSMYELVSLMQVKVAQLYNLRPIPWYWSERNKNTVSAFSIDGVHPSIAGARLMSRWFAECMPL